MFVTPLHPALDCDPPQHQSTRKKEASDSLILPTVRLRGHSSFSSLAVPCGESKSPVHGSMRVSALPPRQLYPQRLKNAKPQAVTLVKPTGSSTPDPKSAFSHHGDIDATWPETWNIGTGLFNSGNSCFVNSALQCLLHTPPVLQMLIIHKRDTCRVEKGICMSCSLRHVMIRSHSQKAAFSPTLVTNKLQVISENLRRGRQEDSHEFLRCTIDALQKSCLSSYEEPLKVDPKLAEMTWVYKIFGGQLRSRVTCQDCGNSSNTFDRTLDLSVDICQAGTLQEALEMFVAEEHLGGLDEYQCENCNKNVNALKRFTVHEAPLVLTIHLKRFTFVGSKIGRLIHYDDELSLQPYMSEGRHGPTYSLYGVVCHAGEGLNSGHYYSYVKSRDGEWWEMNDETVSLSPGVPPKTNAYVLFYQRKQGQERRERENAVEHAGIEVSASCIAPRLPSQVLNASGSDPRRHKVNKMDPHRRR